MEILCSKPLYLRRQRNLPTFVAFIDLVKTSDTANHVLLIQVLKCYDVPSIFCDIVRRLYTDLKVISHINVKGEKSWDTSNQRSKTRRQLLTCSLHISHVSGG